MSTMRMLSAKENLLEAVLEYLPADRDDYSSTALLFQGKRPAHFIRKALAARRGRACIPPAIFSLENYISYCYRDVLKLDDADITRMRSSRQRARHTSRKSTFTSDVKNTVAARHPASTSTSTNCRGCFPDPSCRRQTARIFA